eukprot:189607_1
METIPWSVIIAIAYFIIYFTIFILTTYCAHIAKESEETTSFLQCIWLKRAIYMQTLMHLVDTASDLFVLLLWWFYSRSDDKIGNILNPLNITILFWISFGSIIVYRVISILVVIYIDKSNDATSLAICLDVILCLFDMYILKTSYLAIKVDCNEPMTKQKTIHLCEAVFESLPQFIIQSVFIIHAGNNVFSSYFIIVCVSLLSSILNVTNKCVWLDMDGVVEEAKNANYCRQSPFINKWYMLRIIWRVSHIVTNLTIVSLIWCVFTVKMLVIFLSISFVIWLIFIWWASYQTRFISGICDMDIREMIIIWGLSVISMIVAVPCYQAYEFAFIHEIKVIFVMILITGAAADYLLSKTVILWIFIAVAWIMLVIDLITYMLMLCFKKFEDDIWGRNKSFIYTIPMTSFQKAKT